MQGGVYDAALFLIVGSRIWVKLNFISPVLEIIIL
jgi:hypothetical protein